jgi:hypothetical protein
VKPHQAGAWRFLVTKPAQSTLFTKNKCQNYGCFQSQQDVLNPEEVAFNPKMPNEGNPTKRKARLAKKQTKLGHGWPGATSPTGVCWTKLLTQFSHQMIES